MHIYILIFVLSTNNALMIIESIPYFYQYSTFIYFYFCFCSLLDGYSHLFNHVLRLTGLFLYIPHFILVEYIPLNAFLEEKFLRQKDFACLKYC